MSQGHMGAAGECDCVLSWWGAALQQSGLYGLGRQAVQPRQSYFPLWSRTALAMQHTIACSI
jgi:hypothetical protein